MANKYGLTEQGFIRKRLPEIQNDIFTSLDQRFGQQVSRKPNSVIGLLVGIFSAEIDNLWMETENVYNAMYPSTADGVQLDNSASFTGVKRITAEKTSLYIVCTGQQNTILPRYMQIQGDDNEKYELPRQAVISSSNCVDVFITVPLVQENMLYTLTIDGQTFTYTAVVGETNTAVLNYFNSNLPEGWSGIIETEVLIISKNDRQYGSNIVTSTTLNVFRVASPVLFEAENYGAINPPVNSITKVITQVVNLETVNNPNPAYVGRNTETDTQIRQRYSRSVHVLGTTMVESIEAAIYEYVEGVTSARVYENNTDSIDSDGRSPHSIEAIVQGGDPIRIASIIRRKKAAGIDTFGTQMELVADSQGIEHPIYFNRPTELPIWVKVTLTKNPEEDFPGDTAAQVANIVVAEGNKLSVGTDIVLQKFFCPVFAGTHGIGLIEMQLSLDGNSYSNNNITLGVRELAVFDISRITVVVNI